MPKSGTSRFRAVKVSPDKVQEYRDSTATKGETGKIESTDKAISREKARTLVGDTRLKEAENKASKKYDSTVETHSNKGIPDPSTREKVAKEQSEELGDELVGKVKKALTKKGGALLRQNYE